MKTSTPSMALDEACRILGLPPGHEFTTQDVELAYRNLLQKWSVNLSKAVTLEARRLAADTLCRLQDARGLLLRVAGGTGSRAAAQGHSRRAKPSSARRSGTQQNGKIDLLLTPFRVIWTILQMGWGAVRVLWQAGKYTIAAVRASGTGLQSCGAPRLAVFLLLLIGLLSLVYGCVRLGTEPTDAVARMTPTVWVALALLSVLFAALLAAVFFEAVFAAISARGSISIEKPFACRIWWALLFLSSLGAGVVSFAIGLPVFLVVSLSHLELSHRHPEIITLRMILENAPSAVRGAVRRIRPYIR